MKKLIKKRGFKYLVSFLILFFILFAMTIQPMMTDLQGEEILIKTKPFDPRDLFRGDYVQLHYEINDISLEQLDNEILKLKDQEEYNIFKNLEGKKLYVRLKKNRKFHEVDGVTLIKPKEGIFLVAKYKYALWDENKEYKNSNVRGINVDYTLDKYFVSENTGDELEKKARNGEVFVKVKVYKGYSLLKEIVE
ncbi:GDYXXLXY domain-containing protein [Marinisporobacter balticus]|uniref:Putative membrane-anchored protein n=1 Tax=Marinisporobacter balticus TaxID=2018667 RepID=A0A4R2KT22_9FIRM|nr:GDYXXLXY domain-containing protein [Marinisporobacter balticus]TCO76923.1 putative membrane-anchored protein [Marinisporobacter balticus]